MSEGLVEVFVKGQWSSICADLFDANDANVICLQLGYTKAAVINYHTKNPNTLIVLDDLECNGDEQQIIHCKATETATSIYCANNQDVYVQCAY